MKPTGQMQEILDKYDSFEAPPLETLSPENARNLPTFADAVIGVMGAHLSKRAMPFPEVVEFINHIKIQGPEGELLARVYRPHHKDVTERLPILLYFHGGGWVIANLDTYDASCRALCNESGYLLVSVAYRQAPENPFPAAVDDALAAYRWLCKNGESIGGDPLRIAVAGESAGGNLAAVVCLKAKAQGLALPLHQLLIYPVTDFTFQGDSHRTRAEEKPLNQAMMEWFKKHYLQNTDPTHPDASPLFARSHSGLPRATIIAAELDPLCSDSELYAEKLRAGGVPVQYKKFRGVTHEFFGAKAVLEEAKSAVTLAGDELLDALDEYSLLSNQDISTKDERDFPPGMV